MEHFVTLFDSHFLPQGLALHASLQRHHADSMMWVLCMDDAVQARLESLQLPGLRCIALAEAEVAEPRLNIVRPKRSRAEYCWTLTPLTPKLVFDRCEDANRVTYVDADVYFLDDPALLLEGFSRSGKAVQITDHAYDPEHDYSAVSGKYCVQFVTFVRDISEPVRSWWAEQCIEWCHAHPEPGRFGDQKYLDEWPRRFSDLVHELEPSDRLLAPWNANRFPYGRAVAWHFHGLRLLGNGRVLLHSRYHVPQVVDEFVYMPYVKELLEHARRAGVDVVQARVDRWWLRSLKSGVRVLQAAGRSWRSQQLIVKV
ncbi:MAG: hypothetical protein J0H69_17745 [Burkholderiales bacterium]|nr:hypothetical protein [Burkholderiales bacterium]